MLPHITPHHTMLHKLHHTTALHRHRTTPHQDIMFELHQHGLLLRQRSICDYHTLNTEKRNMMMACGLDMQLHYNHELGLTHNARTVGVEWRHSFRRRRWRTRVQQRSAVQKQWVLIQGAGFCLHTSSFAVIKLATMTCSR